MSTSDEQGDFPMTLIEDTPTPTPSLPRTGIRDDSITSPVPMPTSRESSERQDQERQDRYHSDLEERQRQDREREERELQREARFMESMNQLREELSNARRRTEEIIRDNNNEMDKLRQTVHRPTHQDELDLGKPQWPTLELDGKDYDTWSHVSLTASKPRTFFLATNPTMSPLLPGRPIKPKSTSDYYRVPEETPTSESLTFPKNQTELQRRGTHWHYDLDRSPKQASSKHRRKSSTSLPSLTCP